MPSQNIPLLASLTTIIAVNKGNRALIGADSRMCIDPYGRVLDNTFGKIISLFDGCFLLCSGSYLVTDELRAVLPCCFALRLPKSMREALDRVVLWVNFFTEYLRIKVRMILIGSLGNEPFKTAEILPIPKHPGYMHRGKFFKEDENQVFPMGTGGPIAYDVVMGNKRLMQMDEIPEKRGIAMIFRALKKATCKDHCTGGRLEAYYLRKGAETHYVEDPENPFYCNSEYVQSSGNERMYVKKRKRTQRQRSESGWRAWN